MPIGVHPVRRVPQDDDRAHRAATRSPSSSCTRRTTTFTGANLSESLHGIYRTSLVTSVKLSAIVAIIGAVLGMLLAYAVVSSNSGAPAPDRHRGVAAVSANFGGIPLAFLFIATLDANSGIADHLPAGPLRTSRCTTTCTSSCTTCPGSSLVYLYFLVPLMVLVMTPALEGLKPQWGEAAENLGASRWHYWRYVAGPVLLPNFLGSVLLLFCSSFSAYATAYARSTAPSRS